MSSALLRDKTGYCKPSVYIQKILYSRPIRNKVKHFSVLLPHLRTWAVK